MVDEKTVNAFVYGFNEIKKAFEDKLSKTNNFLVHKISVEPDGSIDVVCTNNDGEWFAPIEEKGYTFLNVRSLIHFIYEE